MDKIALQNTLPCVFEGRDVQSEIWLQDVAFEKGQTYLVEASSGTGKSSLCSYIIGYRKDYLGTILFDGKDIRQHSVSDWTSVRKNSLSLLFQELRLFPELTAMENVQIKNGLTGFKGHKEIEAGMWGCTTYCAAPTMSMTRRGTWYARAAWRKTR